MQFNLTHFRVPDLDSSAEAEVVTRVFAHKKDPRLLDFPSGTAHGFVDKWTRIKRPLLPLAFLQLATQEAGPTLYVRQAGGPASLRAFSRMHKKCMEQHATIYFMLGDNVELHLAPSKGRSKDEDGMFEIFLGLLVHRSCLFRIQGNIHALMLDFDEVIVHAQRIDARSPDQISHRAQDQVTFFTTTDPVAPPAAAAAPSSLGKAKKDNTPNRTKHVVWVRRDAKRLFEFLATHDNCLQGFIVSAGTKEYVTAAIDGIARHVMQLQPGRPLLPEGRVFTRCDLVDEAGKCMYKVLGETNEWDPTSVGIDASCFQGKTRDSPLSPPPFALALDDKPGVWLDGSRKAVTAVAPWVAEEFQKGPLEPPVEDEHVLQEKIFYISGVLVAQRQSMSQKASAVIYYLSIYLSISDRACQSTRSAVAEIHRDVQSFQRPWHQPRQDPCLGPRWQHRVRRGEPPLHGRRGDLSVRLAVRTGRPVRQRGGFRATICRSSRACLRVGPERVYHVRRS
jgi:hypothetical protein